MLLFFSFVIVTPDQIPVPQWVVTAVIVPIALGMLHVLWWIGKREISHYDEEISEIQSEIDRMRRERRSEHQSVEKILERIEGKLDEQA
jgi:uncharacterized membrane protein (DUF106 family)